MDSLGFSTLQLLLLGGILFCCLAGIVLQFFAWRHLKPGVPRVGHKDTLFRKKEQYYTEAGMKYVELQKRFMYAMAILFILALIFGQDPPPAE